MMTDVLPWAAGVFETTGTATLSGGQPMLNLKQAAPDESAGPPELVTRFYAAIGGVGKIGGPYRDNPSTHPRRQPFAMWWARGPEAAIVIERLWPWLGEAKRRQWLEVIDRGRAAA